MIDICVDLETTANGPGHSPEAHYRNNKVLLCGFITGWTNRVDIDNNVQALCETIKHYQESGEIVRLIGHNLKFDLKYLMRDDQYAVLWEDVDIWCTQYTHYRVTGQRDKMISLEDLCDKHSIKYNKSLDLGALIKAGIMPEDIDEEELADYLKEDVLNTWQVFKSQQSNAYNESIFQQHILPIAEMELNGLPIDKDKLKEQITEAIQEADASENTIWDIIRDTLEWDNGDEITEKHIKPMAARTMSYLLTGEPSAGLTKHKTKQIQFQKGKGPLLSPKQINQIWGGKKPNHLGYPMAKYDIEKLQVYASGAAQHLVIELLNYRHWSKLIGTYYSPFSEDMRVSGQDCIYPKVNVSVTGTGRTSSSNPNGQNMPGEARELVKAVRAAIMEIDFTQLEVVGLAFLSGDRQLTTDILNGEDIHYNTGKVVMKWTSPSDMNKDDRKLVKNVNFGVIYGGGAGGLSKQTGQPKALVKKLIDAFFHRYPGVAKWQKQVYSDVVQKMHSAGHQNGEQFYYSIYTDPKSGRKFYFEESPSPGWLAKKTGRGFSFKPTETKNYPVQGFAGGDIVMQVLFEMWRICKKQELPVIFRMTVHDSILIDTDADEADIKSVMQDACEIVRHRFGMIVPLNFDIDVGEYWR